MEKRKGCAWLHVALAPTCALDICSGRRHAAHGTWLPVKDQLQDLLHNGFRVPPRVPPSQRENVDITSSSLMVRPNLGLIFGLRERTR